MLHWRRAIEDSWKGEGSEEEEEAWSKEDEDSDEESSEDGYRNQ